MVTNLCVVTRVTNNWCKTMKTTQTIRNIDEEIYRKVRGKCAELNISTGEAVTEAMKMWLNKKKINEKN